MAYSFANATAGGGGFGGQAQASTGTQVQDGPELQEIQTDEIGFSAINGDAKVRLLPTPWPADNLPPPTSSLMSIASKRGLIAAAGPDALVLTRTTSVRNAFRDNQDQSANIKTIQPEVKISVPRLSQLAFSADENVLMLSSEANGGLQAYQVNKLTNGEAIPVLEISTNGSRLRALVPNPMPDTAELFAAVTSEGELLLADLELRGLRSRENNSVLKSGVSCVSWSNKGRQLVAGLADGSATQMKPDGTIVAEIPKSTSIPAGMHVSAISWLEDNQFFVVYTPNDSTASDGMMPLSEYWIVDRVPKTSNFTFQKLPEVCGPFGLERMPSYHYISRLRKFEPELNDLLLVASSTGIDIGLISKAGRALSDENITGVFTFTSIGDDTRRAQLPLSESMGDTSPIGMGLDLSSTEEIVNPIPSDPEIRQSSTPLPNLLVLNQEGILASWWVVYSPSIREKTIFHGLVAAAGIQQTSMRSPTPAAATPTQSMPPATGGFGQSGFGSATPFAKPAAAVFGTPATSSAIGSNSAPAFGGPSTLGGTKHSWTNTGFGGSSTPQASSGFSQSAFGSATPVGGGGATPAFGSASAIGSRPSPFGTAPTSAFGKPGLGAGGFGGGSAASPFGAAATGSRASGFASFASSNGTTGFGAAKLDGQSPFGKPSSNAPFAQASGPSPFVPKSTDDSAFGEAERPVSNGFLGGNDAFKLESSFKGDGSAKHDLPKPTVPVAFGFGGGFGDLLNEPQKALSPTHDKEAEMGSGSEPESDHDVSVTEDRSESAEEELPRGRNAATSLITPPTTMKQPNITPAPPLSGLFGPGNTEQSTTPQVPPTTAPSFSFGTLPSTTPNDTPAPSQRSIFGNSKQLDETPAGVQEGKPTSLFGENPGQKASQNSAGLWLQNGVDETPEKATTEKHWSKQETPNIKAEPPSDEETVNLNDIPEAPLPPDTTSKTSYTPGGTSVGSDRSKQPSDDDTPLPPGFISSRSREHEEGVPSDGPGDDAEFSSDFEGSGEDVTQDISPIDDPTPENTEHIQTSPESSFGRAGDKSSEESPTGGLFTKVTAVNPSQKPSRTLFGEVGSTGPIFPPPKPHESPRSPSPVRNHLPTSLLRPDAGRSVSAPGRPASVIEQRRAQLGQSGLSRDISATRAKAQAEALAAAKVKAEAEAALQLEDDEDERLRQELAQPVQPSHELQPFVSYQQNKSDDLSKAGIPGQIERLYQDINSMIDTLGINARALSSFMLYQHIQQPDQAWPDVLKSDTPMDSLNEEWVLEDTARLREGIIVLQEELESRKITDVAAQLQQCQEILSRDVVQLRAKLGLVRKALGARSDVESNMNAPLSAEQASIQHDLRKASTAVQMKLTESEETLSMLRAKLSESALATDKGWRGKLARSASQKKPTVEAVTNTIAKMMSMAEKKSTDIDVLEAQLKRLTTIRADSAEPDGTPSKGMASLRLSNGAHTPGSQNGSVYHTPDSKFSRSTRSIHGNGLRESMNGALISAEDRTVWKQKAARRKQVADVLKGVLMERRTGRSVPAR